MRRGRTIALASLALLASCRDTQPAGQVIATVDGHDITDTELAAEARAAPAPRGALLERLIDRALLARAARRRDADLSPTFLADLRRTRDLLLADSLRRQVAARLPAPDDARARAYVAAHPWAFADRAQVILVAPDGAATGIDTATADPGTAAAIGAARIGETVPIGGAPYRVLARKPLPVPPPEALRQARAALIAEASDGQVRTLLAQARASATIRYQPGFGPAQER